MRAAEATWHPSRSRVEGAPRGTDRPARRRSRPPWTRLAAAGLAAVPAVLAALAPGPVGPPVAVAEERFDLRAPPETRYRLAPGLTFGAKVETELLFQGNLDLDRRRADDASQVTPELSLAWSLDPNPAFQAFLNLVVGQEVVLANGAAGAEAHEQLALEVKELFIRVRPLPEGLSLQLGRQRFEDEREWLFDTELDAARLWYARGPLVVELSASRKGLSRTDVLSDRDRERIDNYVLRGSYRLLDRIELEGYVIARDDRTALRRRPVFVGVRSRGEPIDDLDYWLELAFVRGRDGRRRIRGWGLDLGATYELQAPWKPALTVGLAFGSGDRSPDDGVDTAFRQTGLQENEGDFGGVASFKYYGQVLDPELSNLAVLTLGVGVRPAERVSLDLVYHSYLQHRASPELRDVRLDAEPSGRSRRLGSALDVVAGVENLLDRVDAKVILGYFWPGAAFRGATGDAWVVAAELQLRF